VLRRLFVKKDRLPGGDAPKAKPARRHRDGEKMSAQGRKRLHREFWPLMMAGLLLAAPAVAADQTDKTKPTVVKPRPSQTVAHKSETHSPVVHPKVAQHADAAAKPAHRKVASTITLRATPRVLHSASIASAAPVRRVVQARGGSAAEGFDRSLLDDGSFWHESGNMATWQQTGMASWYGGPRWQGKRTTSGERYDQNKLTAAHATLPIGTKVRVMRTDGRGSVIVTINDRPGSRTRIIDLSRAAAKELGILGDGVAMVTLQPM
jgi:rare lipoprotein A (peptidoglycan hydrolase)